MSTLEVMGKRIQQRRKEFRITQIDLAKALGLSEDSRSSISRWEKGTDFPSTALIPKLCDILRCDVGYLFGEYELPTRELTDISKETGLSVEAINTLRETNKHEFSFFREIMPVLSWFLSNDLMFVDVLYPISKMKKDGEKLKALDNSYYRIPVEERIADSNLHPAKFAVAHEILQDRCDLLKFKADTAFRKLLDEYYEQLKPIDKLDSRIK